MINSTPMKGNTKMDMHPVKYLEILRKQRLGQSEMTARIVDAYGSTWAEADNFVDTAILVHSADADDRTIALLQGICDSSGLL